MVTLPLDTKVKDMGLNQKQLDLLSDAAENITKDQLLKLARNEITVEELNLTVEDVKDLNKIFTNLLDPAAAEENGGSACCCCTPCCCCGVAISPTHACDP